MTPIRWQEIERIYNAALERPPTDRAAFLTDVCKNDPELRRCSRFVLVTLLTGPRHKAQGSMSLRMAKSFCSPAAASHRTSTLCRSTGRLDDLASWFDGPAACFLTIAVLQAASE
jgi:hypothetical protein